MKPAKFTIEEKTQGGVKFEFTAREHSIPIQPWEFSGLMRTHREDYPGYERPTEQVLGPTYEDFTLSGMWDDKWMGGGSTGVAMQTMRAMEALWRRGNVCHFSVTQDSESIEVLGVLKHVKFRYFHSTKVGYELTVSPHYRDNDLGSATPKIVSATASVDDSAQRIANKIVAARLLMALAPVAAMKGDVFSGVNDVVDDWESRAATIQTLSQTRSFTFEPDSPNSLLRLVQAFEGMQTAAMNVLPIVRGESTDTLMFFADSLLEASYDAWARSMCVQARYIFLDAYEAAVELQRRVTPDALALYRPQAGESLYAISNRFYGTPSKWRDIYDRNALGYFDLTGTEMLVIPGQK